MAISAAALVSSCRDLQGYKNPKLNITHLLEKQQDPLLFTLLLLEIST
jgi:hypothetical protein